MGLEAGEALVEARKAAAREQSGPLSVDEEVLADIPGADSPPLPTVVADLAPVDDVGGELAPLPAPSTEAERLGPAADPWPTESAEARDRAAPSLGLTRVLPVEDSAALPAVLVGIVMMRLPFTVLTRRMSAPASSLRDA